VNKKGTPVFNEISKHRKIRKTSAAVLSAVMILGITISSGVGAFAANAKCATVNIANNPWVGYNADTAVIEYIATHNLKCKVVVKDITEQVSWQGFKSGEIDAILENWGHEDLAATYITKLKVAQDLGSAGNQGIIGWYVAPWMATKYPDILSSKNLNKYASLFKTSESGALGAFLDGDPSYVTNDEALIKNLKLKFKVSYTGSEAALVTAFRNSEKKKKPVIGYFYEPHWFLSEVALKRVLLPAYTKGCDASMKTIACDYPPYALNKVARVAFMNSGSPAAKLIK
jgi:glycine betaine/proline transport system substrate-binding protein